jgi:hypothetical protein
MAGILFTHRKKKIGEMPGVVADIEQRSNDAITAANVATKATKDATKAADKTATLAAKAAAKARKLAEATATGAGMTAKGIQGLLSAAESEVARAMAGGV